MTAHSQNGSERHSGVLGALMPYRGLHAHQLLGIHMCPGQSQVRCQPAQGLPGPPGCCVRWQLNVQGFVTLQCGDSATAAPKAASNILTRQPV